MKSWIVSIYLVLAMSASAMAFVPRASTGTKSALKMAFVTPPPAVTLQQASQMPAVSTTQSSVLSQGIHDYVGSSTQLVSLVERKPPTKEEIQKKKDNFNFWFWGGGFVAPFLATFYYFGFQFWKR
jgi:hypothetical protein